MVESPCNRWLFYHCKLEKGILKYGVSLEGEFKSEESLKDFKGCLEPKVQEGGLEP